MKKPLHSVRLIHESLAFSASHFITFTATDQRNSRFAVFEPLHGHNFRVRAKITGPVNDQEYVIDFVAATNILRNILEQYHHKILLPKDHPQFHFAVTDDEVEVLSLGDARHWIFPKCDTLFLDCRNSTAESLAEQIAVLFMKKMEETKLLFASGDQYTLELALEEADGMFAEVTI